MPAAARFGVMGLAVMGQNLARNIGGHGIPVAVYNRTAARTDQFMAEHGGEGAFLPARSPAELAATLARPRAVLLMVKAGAPVDAAIAELVPHLEAGDILIDGGNSHFADTQRRSRELEARGLRFLGAGISGGEAGALTGPSIMPGGSEGAYREVEPLLTRIAAQVDGTPCCTFIGADGAGHFVKMVHNGIEYADMQLIAEAYDLLQHALALDAVDLARIFASWNEGELESYLIATTAAVLAKLDAVTGRPLVEVILDEAEQKGTGRWTAQAALDLGVPLPTITEAVFARSLSARKDEREAAALRLSGPPGSTASPGADSQLVEDVRGALYGAKVVAYAQGFAHLAAAAREFGWRLNLGAIATIWRGGCIIRARFLDHIKAAYEADPALPNLMLAPFFQVALSRHQAAWRRAVCLGTELGVPLAAFASGLAYYDAYRRARGPANLIQGLRDYFGAHTYRRIDRPGSFHTRWAQDGAEVDAGPAGRPSA